MKILRKGKSSLEVLSLQSCPLLQYLVHQTQVLPCPAIRLIPIQLKIQKLLETQVILQQIFIPTQLLWLVSTKNGFLYLFIIYCSWLNKNIYLRPFQNDTPVYRYKSIYIVQYGFLEVFRSQTPFGHSYRVTTPSSTVYVQRTFGISQVIKS